MNVVHTRIKAAARDAFTLVEMIVVIGIIVMLAALLVPMISRAVTQATRTKMAADLHVIANGLDAYKLDHKDFPRAGNVTNGAVLLCWALVAPGPQSGLDGQADGADGPGFRLRGTQGQVYGPYINIENFRLVDMNTKQKANPNGLRDDSTAIGDRYGIPIYYCPAAVNPNPNAGLLDDSTTGGLAKFDFNYFKDGGNPILPLADAQKLLTDTPSISSPYLLWSAGVNTKFGYDVAGKQASDDVTNFRN